MLTFRWLLPLITWSWGLLLVATWFDPRRGTLREGSPWLFGARGWSVRTVRAFAALFLMFWFLASIVVFGFWRGVV